MSTKSILMMHKPDYKLKNEILKLLLDATHDSPCTSNTISKYLNISIERSNRLLLDIFDDNNSSQSTYPHQYVKNADTVTFLKAGGYKDESYFEKHPTKEKIFIALLSGVISLLVALAVSKWQKRESDQLEYKQDSAISHENLRLDSLQTYLKDSSKYRLDDTSRGK